MAFSRVHYTTLARIIADATQEAMKLETRSFYTTGAYALDKAALVHDLCALFQQDNERFDEQRFIDACYPTPSS